ncbi:MAG TPA: aconitate hydratase AcnA [Actinocrinis sp.]|nr:aconitate hydratase AcnA [Actinocrinis sp.]
MTLAADDLETGTAGTARPAVLLREVAAAHGADLDRLPYVVRLLLENTARLSQSGRAGEREVATLARWRPGAPPAQFPFLPARVILQDFTGVPVVADLAALRSAAVRWGLPADAVDARIPVDLVIDHSLRVDLFGRPDAAAANTDNEYARNRERYVFLKWARQAFGGLRVLPPGTGIVHQVNLERLARVVATGPAAGVGGLSGTGEETAFPDTAYPDIAYPDTVLGTDSHTTMINGLGVLGWGVGGIEAEAVLLGQPILLTVPRVVGVRLLGGLKPGATATDLVLTITQRLREHGVVGAYVEYFGEGAAGLSLADRATVANMAPEYGATTGFFPVDHQTLAYLRETGRSREHTALVERYCTEQGLLRTDNGEGVDYSDVVEVRLDEVEPSVAGPRRPQDRVALRDLPSSFTDAFPDTRPAGSRSADEPVVRDGDVVLAAITSCTNTSNPALMVAAGLLARGAAHRGLTVSPRVKTSLAPGSRAVTGYLERAGLMADLERLGFGLVGYGCTTCHGMSGPLVPQVAEQISRTGAVGVAVLSGNRNFEGRVHPQIRGAYLASPPLVVAYALAGSVLLDLTREPLGHDAEGRPVMLADIWPSGRQIADVLEDAVRPELFHAAYADLDSDGATPDARWSALPTPPGDVFAWDEDSTYVRQPPFFDDVTPPTPGEGEVRPDDIVSARILALLGDSITTDHISPVGSIAESSAAGRYLIDAGVPLEEFNSYGTRRGNHEVMVRGTFGNIRLRNAMVPDREGPWTRMPDGEIASIYEASLAYRAEGVPLVVVAGKEYGCGSSRDWAAKGTQLLGVRAVLAKSFERIHRANLAGMGVLPLEFPAGQDRETLGLDGSERLTIRVPQIEPGAHATVEVERAGGTVTRFEALVRLDSAAECDYYRHGGLLPHVLRNLLGEAPG